LARAKANPEAKWWEVMDTGPFISDTFRGHDGEVSALKGVALKVGPDEDHTFLFDTETLRMVSGFRGIVELAGTPWDGGHKVNCSTPKDQADYFFTSNWGPGWAIDGKWDDPRKKDNGRANGPLPGDLAKFRGIYRHEGGSVLSYTVGNATVLEKPALVDGFLVRALYLSGNNQNLQFLVSDPFQGIDQAEAHPGRLISLRSPSEKVGVETLEGGRRVVNIPADFTGGWIHLAYSLDDKEPAFTMEAVSPDTLTQGSPALYPETIEVKANPGASHENTYTIDTIPLPIDNPWKSEIRFGGFDFFSDGKRVACSTWNGDVWVAEGIDSFQTLTWRRFASGLYQTLGLKIVDDTIYTLGRDQITRLHDLNDDGEADFYECFNNDVRITEGFHEFAFDLQTDKDGNFYFSKGQPVQAGGRGFSPWTEHSGTVLKVSRDGKTLTRMAWGLRAPGGIGVSPEGILTTGENEGSYVPRCKITWTVPGKDEDTFHGVVPSEWNGRDFVRKLDGAPTDYQRPLCWLPYVVDNSSGSQMWVPEDSPWTAHAGQMLHFSYGKSAVYRALVDEVDGQAQGGVYRLPIELTTAVMRGRFHPVSGDLYLTGFRGWQTNGGKGFHRVRLTGTEKPVPTSLKAHKNGIRVSFSKKLDSETASDPRRYSINKWDYVWGPQYGSGRFSIDERDEEARQKALVRASKGHHNQIDSVAVRAATLLEDGKTVFLYIPDMTPAMQMEIMMDLAAADKTPFRETIWNTVHRMHPEYGGHGLDLTNLPEIDTKPIGVPGLILSMTQGSLDDAVVVDRLALRVDKNAAVTPFIDPLRCREMSFEGNIVVDVRDQLAFRLEGTGWASLKIDGEVIMEGELPLESERIELTAGPHDLSCRVRRTLVRPKDDFEAEPVRLQLQWSGENFVWEPVRPSAFRHLPSDWLEARNRRRLGRNLFASVGCIRCHEPDANLASPGEGMPELFEKLPDFHNIGNRLNQGWIESWVRQPKDHCPSVAPDDAHHLAAWMATLKEEEIASRVGDAATGQALADKLHLGPWVEKLTAENRHTAGGLAQFLKDPARHHVDTTFPDLHLSEKEAADLAAWISSKQPKAPEATPGDPDKGRTIAAKRCYVCHEPDVTKRPAYEFAAKPLCQMWKEEWPVKGCLSEEEGNAPELGLNLEEKQALFAFKNADGDNGLKSLKLFVPGEYATRTLERLRCAECHSGQTALPDISLAGEKLRGDWLAGLLKGDVLKIRPYEEARMPAFPSRAGNLALGISSRAGVLSDSPQAPADPALAEAGEKLAGATGYACNACHAAGETPALQAFEGQGPNLQLAGERLREDYYAAWMHWPQRFVPTTIMPKYTSDKTTALNPNFFDADADKQFQALLQWMRTLEGAENAPVTEGH
jgi:mono/diheme cytochrome c family protein